MERMFIAFDHIGPPINSRAMDVSVVSVEDTLAFIGVKNNSFLDQIFTAPVKMEKEYEEHKRVKGGGKPQTDMEKIEEVRSPEQRGEEQSDVRR